MAEDLRVLAEKYVNLTGQIDDVRRAMLACLTNGAGDKPDIPFVSARSKPGEPSPQSTKAAMAAEAEQAIIELLKSQPGMGAAAIAKATGVKGNTTVQRLQRLHAKGLIVREDAGGRAAAS